MMEAARSSEMSVNFDQNTRRYNPEDSHLQHNLVNQNSAPLLLQTGNTFITTVLHLIKLVTAAPVLTFLWLEFNVQLSAFRDEPCRMLSFLFQQTLQLPSSG
jgi:hypothetical protein